VTNRAALLRVLQSRRFERGVTRLAAVVLLSWAALALAGRYFGG